MKTNTDHKDIRQHNTESIQASQANALSTIKLISSQLTTGYKIQAQYILWHFYPDISLKASLMIHWHTLGAPARLYAMTWKWQSPDVVLKAIFHSALLRILTRLYRHCVAQALCIIWPNRELFQGCKYNTVDLIDIRLILFKPQYLSRGAVLLEQTPSLFSAPLMKEGNCSLWGAWYLEVTPWYNHREGEKVAPVLWLVSGYRKSW